MQSSPTLAPGPMAALGRWTVRAPIDASAPTVTNGPIDTSAPIVALCAIALKGSMPLAGAEAAANSATARAKSTYGPSAAQHREPGARRNREVLGDDHRRGAGGREPGNVARVVDERDVAALGALIDAGDTHDLDRADRLRAGSRARRRAR